MKPKPSGKVPPPIPPPYAKQSAASSSGVASKPKESLTRTKSLENILSEYGRKQSPQLARRQATPPTERQQRRNLDAQAKHPVLPSPLKKQIEGFKFGRVNSSDALTSPKPQPGRLLAGKRKPLPNAPKATSASTIDSFLTPIPPRGSGGHNALKHTMSECGTVATTPSGFVAKTYVAVADYTGETEGCLQFKVGDKCVLVQLASNGWWLVNIGGKEGWTPAVFWEEQERVRDGDMHVKKSIWDYD